MFFNHKQSKHKYLSPKHHTRRLPGRLAEETRGTLPASSQESSPMAQCEAGSPGPARSRSQHGPHAPALPRARHSRFGTSSVDSAKYPD